MSTPETLPPPVPRAGFEEFRRQLAGLADPDRKVGGSEATEVRDAAKQVCLIGCLLFGNGLERKTLWSRIGSGIETACAKVGTSGDVGRFLTLFLEHVQADMAHAAACEEFMRFAGTWDSETRPLENRQALLNYLRTHTFAVLAHGRALWELKKEEYAARRKREEEEGGDA